jgi:hypothetical protein
MSDGLKAAVIPEITAVDGSPIKAGYTGDALMLRGMSASAVASSDPTQANPFLQERVRDFVIGVIVGLEGAGTEVTIERVVDEVVELLVNGDDQRSESVRVWVTTTLGLKVKGAEDAPDVREIDRRMVDLVTRVIYGLMSGWTPEITRVNGSGITLTSSALMATKMVFVP